jgi:hypothetical protein
MPRAEFEPATPATERPQTYALDRAATGIGLLFIYNPIIRRKTSELPTGSLYIYVAQHGNSEVSGNFLKDFRYAF